MSPFQHGLSLAAFAWVLALSVPGPAEASQPEGLAAMVLENGKLQRKRRSLPNPKWDSELAAAAEAGLVVLRKTGSTGAAMDAARAALRVKAPRFLRENWRLRIDVAVHASPEAAGNAPRWGTARGLYCGIAAASVGSGVGMVIWFAARGEPL